MPLTITERFDSGEADIGVEQQTRTLRWTMVGDESHAVAEALAYATMPAFWEGLQFASFRLTHMGAGVWNLEARYASMQIKAIGQLDFTFDTSGGTQRLKQSKATVSQNVPAVVNNTKLDFAGAINVGADDKVEGVDVPLPKFAFTITRTIADPLPTAYAALLESLTGCVNIEAFSINISGVVYSFLQGELRYDGSTGGKRGTDAWQITMRFEVSRTATNITYDIPDSRGPPFPAVDAIVVPSKRGWDYLWVRYYEQKIGKVLTAVPRQVNVEQVSEYAFLSILFV